MAAVGTRETKFFPENPRLPDWGREIDVARQNPVV